MTNIVQAIDSHTPESSGTIKLEGMKIYDQDNVHTGGLDHATYRFIGRRVCKRSIGEINTLAELGRALLTHRALSALSRDDLSLIDM